MLHDALTRAFFKLLCQLFSDERPSESIFSSDPLCDGSASTGVISGAVNTLCIAYDAAIQQCTGAVLAAMWAGGKDPDGEPVYGPQAFSRAFVVLASSFFLAALSSAAAAACRHAETEQAGR